MIVDYQNIGSRSKRLNPIWHLGRGMDVGKELNPVREQVCLYILLEIFQREVKDDSRRSILHLEEIADMCIRNLQMSTTKEKNERIIEGLIWSGDPQYLNAFSAPFFNVEKMEWQEHSFRYLEEDMEYSIPEEQYYVYKLTEDSYEIIFMSHEIIDELDIDIQSWVALQLIKSKNYRDALDRLHQLIIRVRKLIKNESRYAAELKRNPKIINNSNRGLGSKHKQNVENQFAEEKTRYLEMERLLNKLGDIPDIEIEIMMLIDKINETRELHDNLAQLVIENIKTEIDIRKNHFHLLWKKPRISFKEALWEDLILQKGFQEPDDMFSLLTMLFSPQTPFIYPLQWSVDQVVTTPVIDIEDDDGNDNDYDYNEVNVPLTDYKSMMLLWKPLFLDLLENKKVQMKSVFDDIETYEKWRNNKFAIELWNQFINSPLVVSKADLLNSNDQRVRLIKELIHEDEVFEALLNKQIVTEFIEKDEFRLETRDNRALIMTNNRMSLKEA
ncbi:hypothetical protein [Peribacillus frigoritolerans]|uniref:hypothetical protein n=1 Tax=Peribacillus frigoritolerans TaxID=450367 RepID=UPI002E1D195F|nr:hypothetical protein [Peribacillus frigoritolerans]